MAVGDEPRRVVHLELHTNDLAAASAFYAGLLAWRTERIDCSCGSYQALLLGNGCGRNGEPGALDGLDTVDALDGGIVECGTPRAAWLPYVEVTRIEAATERARALGAGVLLAPREGPSGWRSIVSTPAGGEIALWEPKR
jgi:predicted enzyme related to lactoylglutathione lyase